MYIHLYCIGITNTPCEWHPESGVRELSRSVYESLNEMHPRLRSTAVLVPHDYRIEKTQVGVGAITQYTHQGTITWRLSHKIPAMPGTGVVTLGPPPVSIMLFRYYSYTSSSLRSVQSTRTGQTPDGADTSFQELVARMRRSTVPDLGMPHREIKLYWSHALWVAAGRS